MSQPNDNTPSKEQRILIVMRKVLTQIVKDVTPGAGMRSPLSDHTINDMRHCLGLIVSREKELLEQSGKTQTNKPHYIDEAKPISNVISLDSLKPNKD